MDPDGSAGGRRRGTDDVENTVFDDTLRQGLAAVLRQSPFLSLVSDDRIGKTLAMMQQSPDTRLTPEIAQGVCVRTASAAVLDGSIGRANCSRAATR